jgi:hypothetical protein
MTVRESPAQPAALPKTNQAPYPAEKARGAEIILTTPTRRAIFIASLAGAIIFAVLLVLIGLTS